MRLNDNVTLYNINTEYDPINNDNKNTKEYVSKQNAQVEEISGNLYYKEYGVFKRGVIRVTIMQQPEVFTHIEYKEKHYSVVDSFKVRNRTYITAEEV